MSVKTTSSSGSHTHTYEVTPSTDLSGIQTQITALDARVKALEVPIVPLPAIRPFLAPVTTRTVTVPRSIDATGKTEVSSALRAFIDSVPNGSIISFPVNAVYKIHASILFHNRHNLIFEGNGTTLQVDATAAGTSAYTSPLFIGDSPSDTNSDIVIHDFITIGNSPTPRIYNPNSEGQANIHSCAVTRLEIYNVTGSSAHADFFYTEHSHDVWVHDCHEINAGRMGVTISSGSDILVENNDFDVSGYCTFDIEPNGSSDACSNITIRNNTVGTWGTVGVAGGGLFLGIEGSHTGAAIDRIVVDGNTVTGDSLRTNCDNGGTASTRMTRITFTNNKGTTAAGPLLYFGHVDGLTVTGNIQPLSSGALTSIIDCTEKVIQS